MDAISIDTAQNVRLQYQVASLGDRLLAAFVDYIILFGYVILVYWGLDKLDIYSYSLNVVLIGLPITFYHVACEVWMNGQSLGKRLRRIKVVQRDGREARLSGYLFRWLLRPLDSFYGVGIIAILINGKGQRLGDMAGGTTVVNIKQRVSLQQTFLVDVPEGYVPRYHRAAELSDGQARYMRQVLTEAKGSTRPAALAALGDKLREKLGIGHELSDDALIDTLLKDYVYLTSGKD